MQIKKLNRIVAIIVTIGASIGIWTGWVNWHSFGSYRWLPAITSVFALLAALAWWVRVYRDQKS